MLLLRLKGRWTPPGQHCQSTEWSLHCSMLSFTQRDHLCEKHGQSTEWSLHCSMLSFRLKGRWTHYVQITLSEHRVISSLFNVVIETQRQMDHPSQHCQSTEWSLHCSMLSFRLKGRWTPPGQHCQSTEWSLHCSMLSLRLKGRWTPWSTLSEHRVISSLFNVVIETQRQMDPPPLSTQSQSTDSKAD